MWLALIFFLVAGGVFGGLVMCDYVGHRLSANRMSRHIANTFGDWLVTDNRLEGQITLCRYIDRKVQQGLPL